MGGGIWKQRSEVKANIVGSWAGVESESKGNNLKKQNWSVKSRQWHNTNMGLPHESQGKNVK